MARTIVAGASTKKAETSPVTLAWLSDQFDQLNRADKLIMSKLEQLKAQNVLILAEIKGSGAGQVIPELEAAIKRTAALGVSIDRKVKDNP